MEPCRSRCRDCSRLVGGETLRPRASKARGGQPTGWIGWRCSAPGATESQIIGRRPDVKGHTGCSPSGDALLHKRRVRWFDSIHPDWPSRAGEASYSSGYPKRKSCRRGSRRPRAGPVAEQRRSATWPPKSSQRRFTQDRVSNTVAQLPHR